LVACVCSCRTSRLLRLRCCFLSACSRVLRRSLLASPWPTDPLGDCLGLVAGPFSLVVLVVGVVPAAAATFSLLGVCSCYSALFACRSALVFLLCVGVALTSRLLPWLCVCFPRLIACSPLVALAFISGPSDRASTTLYRGYLRSFQGLTTGRQVSNDRASTTHYQGCLCSFQGLTTGRQVSNDRASTTQRHALPCCLEWSLFGSLCSGGLLSRTPSPAAPMS